MIENLYLDLMKKSLTNWIYGDAELVEHDWQKPINTILSFTPVKRIQNTRLLTQSPMREELRQRGEDWPPTAHTMIGIKRLDNIHTCIKYVIDQNIPGDLIEAGVWRGGSAIFMKAALTAHGDRDRRLFVADSFEGLPKPDSEKYPADRGDDHYKYNDVLGVSLENVKNNFKKYGLLDDRVIFLKGWFKDTLPGIQTDRIAVMRVDGDMYESTINAMNALYPKLQTGGFVIIDDYCLAGCRKAVTDYRREHGISETITKIDGTGIYWQKGAIDA